MKFASAPAQLIVFLLLITLSVSCQKSPFSPLPTPTSLPVVNPDNLNFQDSETRQHFVSLNQCIQKTIDANWTFIPTQLNGNFYTSSWCHGTGAPSDCRITNPTMHNRDQHVLSLYTLTYPQDLSSVFGLGLDALWVPAETGWAAHFSFSEKGGGVLADHWGVRFDRYSTLTHQIESTALLWSYDQYQILETLVQYSFDLPLRDDLALYMKSAQAMRDRRLEQIQALAQKVKTTIETHQVEICDLGPYLNDGIPPKCTLRSLTPEEEAEELLKAEKNFSDQTQIMNENYQELYPVWLKAFPMDQCWP